MLGASPGALKCQVAGCDRELPSSTAYYKRYRICRYHSSLASFELSGRTVRWCQQCTTFQDVCDFDGSKRSCRKALEAHNARRRKQAAPAEPGGAAPERRRKRARTGAQASHAGLESPKASEGAAALRESGTASGGQAQRRSGSGPLRAGLSGPSLQLPLTGDALSTVSNLWGLESSMGQPAQLMLSQSLGGGLPSPGALPGGVMSGGGAAPQQQRAVPAPAPAPESIQLRPKRRRQHSQQRQLHEAQPPQQLLQEEEEEEEEEGDNATNGGNLLQQMEQQLLLQQQQQQQQQQSQQQQMQQYLRRQPLHAGGGALPTTEAAWQQAAPSLTPQLSESWLREQMQLLPGALPGGLPEGLPGGLFGGLPRGQTPAAATAHPRHDVQQTSQQLLLQPAPQPALSHHHHQQQQQQQQQQQSQPPQRSAQAYSGSDQGLARSPSLPQSLLDRLQQLGMALLEMVEQASAAEAAAATGQLATAEVAHGGGGGDGGGGVPLLPGGGALMPDAGLGLLQSMQRVAGGMALGFSVAGTPAQRLGLELLNMAQDHAAIEALSGIPSQQGGMFAAAGGQAAAQLEGMAALGGMQQAQPAASYPSGSRAQLRQPDWSLAQELYPRTEQLRSGELATSPRSLSSRQAAQTYPGALLDPRLPALSSIRTAPLPARVQQLAAPPGPVQGLGLWPAGPLGSAAQPAAYSLQGLPALGIPGAAGLQASRGMLDAQLAGLSALGDERQRSESAGQSGSALLGSNAHGGSGMLSSEQRRGLSGRAGGAASSGDLQAQARQAGSGQHGASSDLLPPAQPSGPEAEGPMLLLDPRIHGMHLEMPPLPGDTPPCSPVAPGRAQQVPEPVPSPSGRAGPAQPPALLADLAASSPQPTPLPPGNSPPRLAAQLPAPAVPTATASPEDGSPRPSADAPAAAGGGAMPQLIGLQAGRVQLSPLEPQGEQHAQQTQSPEYMAAPVPSARPPPHEAKLTPGPAAAAPVPSAPQPSQPAAPPHGSQQAGQTLPGPLLDFQAQVERLCLQLFHQTPDKLDAKLLNAVKSMVEADTANLLHLSGGGALPPMQPPPSRSGP